MTEKTFNPGDKVAWLMPMDIYEGIVIEQRGTKVELLYVVGPNDQTHPDSSEIDAARLNLVRAASPIVL